MNDPLLELDAKTLSLELTNAVDKFCEKSLQDDAFRSHLGASIIAHECIRYPWLNFRWVRKASFDGRMLRLFDRGKKEEKRVIDWLIGVGFNVNSIDPETGKQYIISEIHGHAGGAIDAKISHPHFTNGTDFLLEIKTHKNTRFNQVKKKGVIIGEPQHYGQMCKYGIPLGLTHGIYVAINKDTDEIDWQFVRLSENMNRDLLDRARNLIGQQVPPPRISNNPAYTKCKMCEYHGICHLNDPIERNCRSCVNAVPCEDAQWKCTYFGSTIPKDFLPKGCENWKGLEI